MRHKGMTFCKLLVLLVLTLLLTGCASSRKRPLMGSSQRPTWYSTLILQR